MMAMVRRFHFRQIVVVFTLFLMAGYFCAGAQESKRRGRKYKAPPPMSRIEVTVLRDEDSKPIENAAVIFHTLKEEGNMELKSNEDGKAVIDVLPVGDTARLQIIAKGFQTFGQDYPIDKNQMNIAVRMRRPGKQYSIYGDRGGRKTEDQKDQDKPKGESNPDPKPQQQR